MVDDSVVIRHLVRDALDHDPALLVVGTASNGVIELLKIPQLNPDVLTLDIEMPDMDGLETLRRVRLEYPALRVIMFSTLTERGAAITLEALTLGADDYVAKASNEGSLDRSLKRLREELVPKIKQFFHLAGEINAAPAQPGTARTPLKFSPATGRPKVVVIGVSTGGPTALGEILPELPVTFPLPVLVVQHMPPLFTRLLAERLNATRKLAVEEAHQGKPVDAGKILIAPGDFHLKVISVAGGVHVYLDQSAQENSCRPAVDALVTSVSREGIRRSGHHRHSDRNGQDGRRGTEILKALGATVIAQDAPSSLVWGMPGAVVNAGLADFVLPLNRIAPEIQRLAY